MNVAVDLSLVDDSLVCLRDDGDEVVEKYDDHEEGLDNPNEPDQRNNGILFRSSDFTFLLFVYPAFVHWLVKVTN